MTPTHHEAHLSSIRRTVVGNVLSAKMNEKGLSSNALAQAAEFPTGLVRLLLDGECPISKRVAIRLAYVFGTTEDFWLDLETSIRVS